MGRRKYLVWKIREEKVNRKEDGRRMERGARSKEERVCGRCEAGRPDWAAVLEGVGRRSKVTRQHPRHRAIHRTSPIPKE